MKRRDFLKRIVAATGIITTGAILTAPSLSDYIEIKITKTSIPIQSHSFGVPLRTGTLEGSWATNFNGSFILTADSRE